MSPRALTAAITTLLCLTVATPAHAATTIGSTLSQAPNVSVGCAGGAPSCAYSQGALPGRQTAALSAGVLVRWRSRISFSGNRNGTLRLLRPTAGGFTAVAHSDVTALVNGSVGTYPVRIPVAAGDLIGISGSLASLTAFRGSVASAALHQFVPPLTDGATGSALGGPTDNELLVNADIEPDADGDGYGDESQDGCPASAASQAPCNADLQVTTTVTATGIGLFTDLTFFVKVRNIGPNKAEATRMSDAIGELMQIDAITTDAGSCAPGQTVNCDLGALDPGKTVTIRIDATGIRRGAVHAVATGSSSSPDPNPANNSAAADTAVLNPGACGNNIKGGAGADNLTGTAAGDQIDGGAGNDVLHGDVGYDCLSGGVGNDRIYGDQSDDRLAGGAGNDTLDGGEGNDTFSGGAGNDLIDSRDKISEKVNCGKGRDRVRADRKDKLSGCEKRIRK